MLAFLAFKMSTETQTQLKIHRFNEELKDLNLELNKLNDEINKAHLAHYGEGNPFGLHQPKGNPTANSIYHLYDDGEVTYQKGGHAYMRRNEFTFADAIVDVALFSLPKTTYCGNETYAILTQQEAMYFNQKITELLKKYKVIL